MLVLIEQVRAEIYTDTEDNAGLYYSVAYTG